MLSGYLYQTFQGLFFNDLLNVYLENLLPPKNNNNKTHRVAKMLQQTEKSSRCLKRF